MPTDFFFIINSMHNFRLVARAAIELRRPDLLLTLSLIIMALILLLFKVVALNFGDVYVRFKECNVPSFVRTSCTAYSLFF